MEKYHVSWRDITAGIAVGVNNTSTGGADLFVRAQSTPVTGSWYLGSGCLAASWLGGRLGVWVPCGDVRRDNDDGYA